MAEKSFFKKVGSWVFSGSKKNIAAWIIAGILYLIAQKLDVSLDVMVDAVMEVVGKF